MERTTTTGQTQGYYIRRQLGAVKIYVAAVKALREKGETG
jgi:hypothetical protein